MRRWSSASFVARHAGRRARIPRANHHQLSSASCRLLSSTATAQKTERQRLHEEKEALARVAKEKRQRLHEEKHRKAQQAKEERVKQQELTFQQAQERRKQHAQAQESAAERRLRAKRKNAIRSIPYWLGNDEQCFDMTMEALNLKSNQKDKLAAEYKQLYLHSIPSFYQVLVEEIPLKEALDKLLEAGFDDLQWAKRHRQRLENQKDLDRLASRILHTKAQCDKKQAKLQAGKEILECTLQEEEAAAAAKRAKATAEEPSNDGAENDGLISRALSAVASAFSATEEASPSKEDGETPVKVGKKSFKVKRQEGAIVDVEKQLGRLQRSLKRQEEELDSYKFSMTQQEYERANEVVNSVLGDICQELAAHIHERHADTIKQYQALDSKTDLTKPHEWYPHARLDLRKVRLSRRCDVNVPSDSYCSNRS